MKNSILLYILVFILQSSLVACAQDPSNGKSGNNLAVNKASTKDKINLDNIQADIEAAIGLSFKEKSTRPLEEIQKRVSSAGNNGLATYWDAYIDYYLAVYHMVSKENEKSAAYLEDGIAKLEEVDDKSSEHYALLATLQNLSIKYVTGMKAALVSGKVKKNANKALKIDDKNIRAYYALASNDFYTPTEYGGGDEVEKYLLKAISLPDQTVKDPKLPSWGKSYSYNMLIRYHLKNKDKKMASKYFNEAIKLYPDDHELKGLGQSISKL